MAKMISKKTGAKYLPGNGAIYARDLELLRAIADANPNPGDSRLRPVIDEFGTPAYIYCRVAYLESLGFLKRKVAGRILKVELTPKGKNAATAWAATIIISGKVVF